MSINRILPKAHLVDSTGSHIPGSSLNLSGKALAIFFDGVAFDDSTDEFNCESVAPHVANGPSYIVSTERELKSDRTLGGSHTRRACQECVDAGLADWAKPSSNNHGGRIEPFDRVAESHLVCNSLIRACEASSDLVVVMVSFADTVDEFEQHAARVPWYTVAFEDHDTAFALLDVCGAFEGETEVYMWSDSGVLINKHGNATFKKNSLPPYLPLKVSELSESNMSNNHHVNEKPALILFCESATPEEASKFEAMLNLVAEGVLGSSDPPIIFFHHFNLRTWANLSTTNPTTPDFLILDSTRGNKTFTSNGLAATVENLTQFVNAFLSGALNRAICESPVPGVFTNVENSEKMWRKTVTINTIKNAARHLFHLFHVIPKLDVTLSNLYSEVVELSVLYSLADFVHEFWDGSKTRLNAVAPVLWALGVLVAPNVESVVQVYLMDGGLLVSAPWGRVLRVVGLHKQFT
ncbi:hypothetical protein BJ741DRAFT_655062 [Chytriomyces cf. hyalinus JEL632]|nr:hypothetical protein BJ741DRAFT_655062 [Chytriomyces cf. hyalinus JEL632]